MAVERTKSIRNQKPVYLTSSGEQVPGVTTITGLRMKEALVGWAFKIGRENPNLFSVHQYVDDLADIGKAAHEIIASHLQQRAPQLGDFTPNTVAAAQFPVSKYLEWEKGKKIELIFSEHAFVSDLHRFGGTVDVLAKIDGLVTVLDFKTGKAIYDEMFYQVAAYAELVKERASLQIDRIRILQIGRVGKEGFTERVMTDWSLEWQWFLAMRDVYQTERDMERRNKTIEATDAGDPNDMKNWRLKPGAEVINLADRRKKEVPVEAAVATPDK